MDEHGRPAYREPPRPISPGTDRGRIQLLIAFVLGALVILVVHPWGAGGSAATSPAAGSFARSTAAPATPRATPGAASAATGPVDVSHVSLPCGSTDSWRATTMQVWPDRAVPIRSWIAIEPVEAAGPLDPAIPFAPVAADQVTAIGFCAPLDEALRPPVTIRPSLWSLAGSRATSLTLVPADPSDHDTLRGLWLPPSGVVDPAMRGPVDAWPPGRYVIELASPSETYVRWLGIEVLDLGRQRSSTSTASPAPETTAAPS